MTREGWGWTLAAAFGAGLLVSWCHSRSDSAERAAAVARADTLRQRTDSLKAAHVADSTASAQAVARLADSLKRLDRGVDRLRRRSDSLAHAIATAAGDMIPKAQVLAALGGKDALLMRQAVKIATLVADTVVWRGRWMAAAREAIAWHTITLDAQQQLEQANKRAAPKWGCTFGLSALTGGGITVARGVNVGPTLAAGLGASCGLHFRLP